MKIKPFGNRIIVLPIATEYQKTEGGIAIENDLSECVVFEVNEEEKEIFKIGDIVLYHKDSGQSQYYQGKACLWLSTVPNTDIWGIVSEKEVQTVRL